MKCELLNVAILLLMFSPNVFSATLITANKEFVRLPPPCASKIYCHGPLLDAIQMSQLYNDSKTFVDMKLKIPAEDTLAKFQTLVDLNNNSLSKDILKTFVNDHFDEPGSEFENWIPTDWKEHPQFLNKIGNSHYQEWAKHLNEIWLSLGRKMTDDVGVNPDKYSIIHIDHPVIVPGGRFREFYYWDSYWIIRGLLLSEMYETSKGMLQNFLSMIDRFGFIPNGGRIYYYKRSQPPLLPAMIKSYVDKTNDVQFALDSVEILEREFQFWMNNHTVQVKGHNLYVYGDKSNGPRPESYREDKITAYTFETEWEKEEHFSELKAAAESGMDFSSRWFINEEGTNKGSLINLKCRYIVPVELNAILYWNAKIISEFYILKKNFEKAAEYEEKAQDIAYAIHDVLWHDDIGAWLDWDLMNNKRREYFSPTNLSPLWMKCFSQSDQEDITKKVLKYIERIGIDKYPGGVPNTFERTGEQWDFPNVWPPMQYILIVGLKNLDSSLTDELAYSWAERWVLSNYLAFKETKLMFEKYSAEELGGHGGGGEYDIQFGFGWTNGVIMELLDIYGDTLDPVITIAKAESGDGLGDSGSAGTLSKTCLIVMSAAFMATMRFFG